MEPEAKKEENVEHKVHPKFEEWAIGDEWTDHDQAFYGPKKIKFARGAYWFWLFSEINDSDSRKVCAYISRMGKNHEFNGKYVTGKNYSDREFRGAGCCWVYEDRKVTPIFHGNCETVIGPDSVVGKLTDSRHEIIGGGKFPNYTLKLMEDGGELGSFRLSGCNFSESLQQNKFLKMRSNQMISDEKQGFAKIDRVSQYPYCASNMADLFSTYEGKYQDWDMSGKVWVERARSFGMVANWKLLLVYFKLGSRLWFRRFTGKTLNYQEPMSFYFDHIENGNWTRYPFYVHDWVYYKDELGKGKHTSVYDDTRYLHVTGTGPKGDIDVLLAYNDAFLARYRSWRFEARYYQLAFDVVSLKLTTREGRVITRDDLGESVSYGEETFKRKWRDTFFESDEEARRKYVKHDLEH